MPWACASVTRLTAGRWTRRRACRWTSCCRPWPSATELVHTCEQFTMQHKDGSACLQIADSRPTRAQLKVEDIKQLADALHAPPHLIDEGALWQAYAALDKSKVKGARARRILTDL